ncbi:MAG: hypothetical protein E7390_06430 [Ruminococcaceae bacterium]|nr:hypothetical protein [Oscillospiraceae bacterium]
MKGTTRKKTLTALLAGLVLLANTATAQAALVWKTRDDVELETGVVAKENLLPGGMFVGEDSTASLDRWNVNGSGEAIVSSGDGAGGTNSVSLQNGTYITSPYVETNGKALLLSGYYHVPTLDEGNTAKIGIQAYGKDANGDNVTVTNKSYSMTQSATLSEATEDWTFFCYELPQELNGSTIATVSIWLRNTTGTNESAVEIKFSSVRICTDPFADIPENLLSNGTFQAYTEEGGVINRVTDWDLGAGEGTIAAKKEANGNVYVEMTNATKSKNTGIHRYVNKKAEIPLETNGIYRLSYALRNTTNIPSTRVTFYDANGALVGAKAQMEITMKPVTQNPSADTWTEYEGFFTAKVENAADVTQMKMQIYCVAGTDTYHIDNIKLVKTRTNMGFADATGTTITAVKTGTVLVESVLLPKVPGQAPMLFACEYTPDKRLKQLVIGTVEDLNSYVYSAPGYHYKGSATLTNVEATSTLKAFAWDGALGMTPLGIQKVTPVEG